MRRLRGTGLAIMILAGMSGCAGVNRHLSWPSNETSQVDDSDSSRSAWWKRPTPDRSFAADPGPSTAETPQNGTVVIGADSGRDIWSADRNDGLARYFPNTVRTWNRFTSRFHVDGTEHFDEVPVQTSKHADSERTALNNAARDRQVKTTRMTESREELEQANTGPKQAGNSRVVGVSAEKDDNQPQSADATSATVFYEPTAVGRPRPLTYADLARDPAANGAVIEDDNIRPAAASRVDSDAAPVTLLVAMNDSPTATRTVALTDTAIPDSSSTQKADGQNSPMPSDNSSATSPTSSNPPVRSISTTSTDGSATSAIRRKLSDIRTTATDQPALPSPASANATTTPAATGAAQPLARLASNSDVPASTGVAPAVLAVPSTPVVQPASKSVAATNQSPSPSPQAALASEHNHVLFGWLCPLKKKTHNVTPSSQIPMPAYPTSYDSCNVPKVAKCKSPAPSPQSEGCTEADTPKKPCFLKTWLHTSAQASLEEPAVLPQSQLAITPPLPRSRAS